VIRVFVYGSLLRGEASHHVIERASFVGVARTASSYALIDLGPYPALLRHGSDAIEGELYELAEDVLAAVDDFEGHPVLYRRDAVALEDGTVADAYFFERAPPDARRIPGGSWRLHLRVRVG
jgi:gamma-glutamylcyclotransferase (GGCT)/AIG2-like uncharacterized protein YtfP